MICLLSIFLGEALGFGGKHLETDGELAVCLCQLVVGP